MRQSSQFILHIVQSTLQRRHHIIARGGHRPSFRWTLNRTGTASWISQSQLECRSRIPTDPWIERRQLRSGAISMTGGRRGGWRWAARVMQRQIRLHVRSGRNGSRIGIRIWTFNRSRFWSSSRRHEIHLLFRHFRRDLGRFGSYVIGRHFRYWILRTDCDHANYRCATASVAATTAVIIITIIVAAVGYCSTVSSNLIRVKLVASRLRWCERGRRRFCKNESLQNRITYIQHEIWWQYVKFYK